MGFKSLQQKNLFAGNSIQEAADIFKAVLSNKATQAQTDVVIANSALAIRVICPTKDIETCKQEAIKSLESGKAASAFAMFLSCYKM